MTATPLAGAAPHHPTDWHAINWPKVYQNVRRLQARIVQAVRAGRWGKVKALQRLLTHSFVAKALAVKRVTSNPGRRTPGVRCFQPAVVHSMRVLWHRIPAAKRYPPIYPPRTTGAESLANP